jgi:hypothetical protein
MSEDNQIINNTYNQIENPVPDMAVMTIEQFNKIKRLFANKSEIFQKINIEKFGGLKGNRKERRKKLAVLKRAIRKENK